MDEVTQDLIRTMGILALVALYAVKWAVDQRDKKREDQNGGLKPLLRTMLKDLEEHRLREERVLVEISEAERQQTAMIEKFVDRETMRWDKVADAIDRLKDVIADALRSKG